MLYHSTNIALWYNYYTIVQLLHSCPMSLPSRAPSRAALLPLSSLLLPLQLSHLPVVFRRFPAILSHLGPFFAAHVPLPTFPTFPTFHTFPTFAPLYAHARSVPRRSYRRTPKKKGAFAPDWIHFASSHSFKHSSERSALA